MYICIELYPIRTMRDLLKKISVIFTAFLLIAATGGYSLYQHFCNCEDTVITSVFLEIQCEHDEGGASTASCCATSPHERSCCAAESGEQTDGHCHPGDCCHTSIRFFKIDDSFNTGQFKTSFKVMAVTTPLIENEILLKEDEPGPLQPFVSDSSPPLTGRQILLEIHQLKLAPELA